MMHYSRLILALLVSFVLSHSANAQTPANTDRWEATIKAFEESDRTNPPPQNAVLFIGSSSIRMWKTLAEDFPEHKVINRGFGGSEIADSVRYADRIVLPYRPKIIAFYAGDNDLSKGKSPEQVLADFKEFVARVHSELPKTKIVFIAIKPSPSRWKLKDRVVKANALIEQYCSTDKRLSYADIYTPMLGADGLPRRELFIKDMLHLSPEGYDLWTSIVKPHLQVRKVTAPATRR